MPIRAGRKIALATLGIVLVVTMLCENGLIEVGPRDVYFVVSVCKDILLCCPEVWEDALNYLLRSLGTKVLEFFMRIINYLCPRANGDDEENPP